VISHIALSATRYHDLSCGHRVAGHENKCAYLHGHNYRIHFTLQGVHTSLDTVGRVLDFGCIKSVLCQWLEDNWDHKMLLWDRDDEAKEYFSVFPTSIGVVWVPFNPTAENMAYYLLVHGNNLLGEAHASGKMEFPVQVTEVVVEETRKCSARARRENM
jgi:6-pyruvoyltetrahydropterin/6-carboxytetrahydropterin synthase